MASTCSETVDVLWKSALVGILGFMVYSWAVKEGIVGDRLGTRAAAYATGRMKSWVA